MLLIAGAIVVFGSVLGGYLLHGGALAVLIQPTEFLIIGGAAIGTIVMSTPASVLKRLLDQIKHLFAPAHKPSDYLELLTMLYQVFRLIQQSGIMAVEAHVEEPAKSSIFSRFPRFLSSHHAAVFLTDSLKVMIVGGLSPHDLENLMDADLELHHEEALKPAAALTKVGDALPGLGIVAAVLGVVITMGAIDGPPAEIGEKVGAALVGTFLGIFLAYGFAAPTATRLEHQVADNGRYVSCIKAGLLAVYKGLPPAVAIEFARRVLPDEVRPTFEATEKACKSVKSADAQQAAA